MQHHTINVSRTAHYYVLGQPGPHIRRLWIVCHGYAQLADEFLEQFRLLDDGETLVVAPEGLNHFYRKGFDGPPGANWMTRRHRETEIADYAHYLQELLQSCREPLPTYVRVVLLGFSQGTATVCRWILKMMPLFDDLVLWAGLPPEDLDYAAQRAYLETKNLYLLYGTHDPFLTPDRLDILQKIEAENGVDFGDIAFEGGHEIPDSELRALLQR
ncbi:MAG: phospholipase, partial [Saprospiraceae bacterium]